MPMYRVCSSSLTRYGISWCFGPHVQAFFCLAGLGYDVAWDRARLGHCAEGPVSGILLVMQRDGDNNAYRHDLTDTTREMAKRGTDDLKKLALLQSDLVRVHFRWLPLSSNLSYPFPVRSHARKLLCRRHRTTFSSRSSRSSARSKSARSVSAPWSRASRSLWKTRPQGV